MGDFDFDFKRDYECYVYYFNVKSDNIMGEIRIAVLAKSASDFRDFLKNIKCNSNAIKNFIYIDDEKKTFGNHFDAIMETSQAYQHKNYDGIFNSVIVRVRGGNPETRMDKFFSLVLEECEKQDSKWGKNREKHPLEWFSILSEEIGEISKEFNDNSFAATLGKNYETELIQSAAVLFRMFVQNDINKFGKSFKKDY